MIRHSQLHDDQEHDDDDSMQYRPPYALTVQQIQALQRIQHVVSEDDEPDSDNASESDEEMPKISEEELRQLEKLALSLMLASEDHRCNDQEYQNVLINGMAVLKMDRKDGRLSPLAYTTKIAGMYVTGNIDDPIRPLHMRA